MENERFPLYSPESGGIYWKLEEYLGIRKPLWAILREISPEYSLAGLMLKLKRQYFGHLMRRTDSLEKTLMVGKIGRAHV